MKKYTCPYCKEVQTTAQEWQTASIPNTYDLATGYTDGLNLDDIVLGDVESWSCPNCGEDLPKKITEKLFEII